MINYLSEHIKENMTITEIIQVFKDMCQIPVEDDLILFETGIFDFTGEDLFYFSLVRQYPNEEDEYYQIHVDLTYQIKELYQNYTETTWSDEVDNIFDYIKQTKIYSLLKDDHIYNIEVYIDET